MNEPLLDGIASLSLEFQELRTHIELLTERYGRSLLAEAFASKINDIMRDIDELLISYQYMVQFALNQKLYKTLEDQLVLLKRQRDILTVLLEAFNQHLNIINQANSNERNLKCIENFKRNTIAMANPHVSLINQRVLLLYSSTYKMTTLLADKGIFIVAMPVFDLRSPWYWTLIAHEIGHIFCFIKSREINRVLLPILAQYLSEKALEHMRLGVSNLVWRWQNFWLPELVSDLFGCALFGPSFTASFISWLQRADILTIENTHPPMEARVFVQLEYINEICPSELVKPCKQYWNTLSKSVKSPRSQLSYPFDYEILGHVVDVFKDFVPNPPIAGISEDILRVKKAFDSGKVEYEDPLVMVCALAISEKKLELREDILKAIEGDL